MSQKRQPEIEDESNSDEKRQKVPALKEAVLDVLKMNRVQTLLGALEPLVRRVVKEEVEAALKKHLVSMTRQCSKQIHPSASRNLQLKFSSKLCLPIFTGTRIEGEDCSTLKINLIDSLTAQIVDSGLESSMKIEIVVLEGDFEEDGNWTIDYFKNNIVRERQGKRSLLTGDVVLELKGGIGVVDEISFTDNSSWTRSRKFRIGARVVDGYFDGVRVCEAITEPFIVKDHRGELYKKHHPPALSDEVWRLEKIGKDGAFHKRLSSASINTVKDFLTMLSFDSLRLKNILGNGMSAKMWETTVEHARTCVRPSQLHVYANRNVERGIEKSIVFNIVGEVVGVISQQQLTPVCGLSESEKAEAQNLVKHAFNNWNDVVAYNDTCASSSSSNIVSNSLPSMQANNIFSNSFTPFTISDDVFLESDNVFAMQATLPCSPLLFDDCVQHFLDSDLLTQNVVGGLDEEASDIGTVVTAYRARLAAKDKAKTVWGTLVSVLRWRLSIKKIVATKRKGNMKVMCV